MVDIHSISAEGYKKIGGKASPGSVSGEGSALTFQSILLEAQMQRISAWSQTGLNSTEPVNLFNEYRIILEQARRQNAPNNDPAQAPRTTLNPQIIARHYQVESNRVFLEAANPGAEVNPQTLSLADLAQLAGGIRGLPVSQFQQLIQTESGFNPNAVGPGGGLGLGQLLPDTARALGLRTGEDKDEGSVWHPASNLDATARQLRTFHDQFIDRGVSNAEAWQFATGAYNAGIGNIMQALDLLKGTDRPEWNQLAQELPRVTGSQARGTIEYVDRLK